MKSTQIKKKKKIKIIQYNYANLSTLAMFSNSLIMLGGSHFAVWLLEFVVSSEIKGL